MNPGTPAKQGAWDIADAGWGPDWYPNGQKTWFAPHPRRAQPPAELEQLRAFQLPDGERA